MQKSKLLEIFIILLCSSLFSQWDGPQPTIDAQYLSASKHFQKYDVILEPDKNEPDWWAGAPSVARDDNGVFWLACRMRTANSPRGLRGYEIRLLRSEDGVHFNKVKSILRELVPIPGFERPALLFDKTTKKFKLYACGPFQDGPWCIIKFDDVDSPSDFDPSTARAVIEAPQKKYARDQSVIEYKDPFLIQTGGDFHCYVTGYVRRNERLFHFKSADGETWQPVGDVNQPILDLNLWHNFFIRPASVLPLGLGWLFIYEGSSTKWYDPVYNLGTGFGFTFDLHNITDLTTDSPIALSTTPGEFYTFRYSHWLWVDGDIWVYAEAARENNSNEVRLFRIAVESQK